MKQEYLKPIIVKCKCSLEGVLLINASKGDADDSEILAPMAHGSLFDDGGENLSLDEEQDW